MFAVSSRPSTPSRSGLSLLETTLAVAVLAIAATAAIPTLASPVDRLTADAYDLRSHCGLARDVAILHNAAVTIMLTADGYTVTSPDPDAAAAIVEASPSGQSPVAIDLIRSGQTMSPPTTASGNVTSWTFDPAGGLQTVIEPVEIQLQSGGRQLVVRVDFRTGLAELVGPPTTVETTP